MKRHTGEADSRLLARYPDGYGAGFVLLTGIGLIAEPDLRNLDRNRAAGHTP